jgi:hypothetical protein
VGCSILGYIRIVEVDEAIKGGTQAVEFFTGGGHRYKGLMIDG